MFRALPSKPWAAQWYPLPLLVFKVSLQSNQQIILLLTSPPSLGRDTPGLALGLGTPGDSGAGHSRDTLDSGLGTLGRLWGLGISGRLGGWALQGHCGVGHSRDERGVDRARRRVPSEEKSSGRGPELSVKSNNPTPRVGKNGCPYAKMVSGYEEPQCGSLPEAQQSFSVVLGLGLTLMKRNGSIQLDKPHFHMYKQLLQSSLRA